jgi:hypothetical protein
MLCENEDRCLELQHGVTRQIRTSAGSLPLCQRHFLLRLQKLLGPRRSRIGRASFACSHVPSDEDDLLCGQTGHVKEAVSKKPFHAKADLFFFGVIGPKVRSSGDSLAAGSVQGSLFAFVFSSQQAFSEITGLGIIFRWRSQPSRSASR